MVPGAPEHFIDTRMNQVVFKHRSSHPRQVTVLKEEIVWRAALKGSGKGKTSAER
jgi:hypothetical protein